MLIREKDKLSLYHLFKAVTVPIEVWAYGSRVNGSAHETSDLDLVLRTHNLQPLPQNEFSKLLDSITESNIPILVDLKEWARIPDSFQKQIQKQYEVFYTSFIAN
jgi:predicted nucleotidyltransferase